MTAELYEHEPHADFKLKRTKDGGCKNTELKKYPDRREGLAAPQLENSHEHICIVGSRGRSFLWINQI